MPTTIAISIATDTGDKANRDVATPNNFESLDGFNLLYLDGSQWLLLES